MIRSKSDLRIYLQADGRALGGRSGLKSLVRDEIWRFQFTLRWLEYAVNGRSNVVLRTLLRVLYRRQSIRLGFTIPLNVFGPGLSIAHRGTIVVNSGARVGANCRIHTCVNIGTAAGQSNAAPIIGDNCYVGPGAKIFGAIEIGPDVAIGANAVVNKSFPEGGVTLGGIPARVISQSGSGGLHVRGYVAT